MRLPQNDPAFDRAAEGCLPIADPRIFAAYREFAQNDELIYTKDQAQTYSVAAVQNIDQFIVRKECRSDLDGKMEQFWLRHNEAGVIFLMTVDSVAEADALLKALPLGQANLLTFDLMPIGALSPLGMLIR